MSASSSAVVPHLCLEKTNVHTSQKHFQRFQHIGYNVNPYGQSFFPNSSSAWNGLAKDIDTRLYNIVSEVEECYFLQD